MQLFLTLTWLVAFVSSVLAQRIAIGAPAEWTNVQPGQNITVRVDRPVRNPPSISFNDS